MIHIERFDGAAVIAIDHPPVNATSQAVRQGLLDALASAIADDTIGGIVIIGRHDRFSAGGDVRELGNTALNRPSLRDSIALIERSPKPVVAAMTGVALGGGLELALGCQARVGADPLKLGLPEVTLGVIPGAGGTQRLPRIVGAQAALDIATTGRHFSAREAHALGLLDALCEQGRLLETALLQLRSVRTNEPAPRSEVTVDPDVFARYRESRRAMGRPARAVAHRRCDRIRLHPHARTRLRFRAPGLRALPDQPAARGAGVSVRRSPPSGQGRTRGEGAGDRGRSLRALRFVRGRGRRPDRKRSGAERRGDRYRRRRSARLCGAPGRPDVSPDSPEGRACPLKPVVVSAGGYQNRTAVLNKDRPAVTAARSSASPRVE
ncbi:enoyl-CoA hydratase/isomerase family protein [Hydrocarboniphaga effusa]|uniref:enoyl-CoA hydratase/isomerase family protein n=1 Tax=Hydrocarboniphaga effusa TaxID=243629 RepID=UPI003138031A